MDKPKRKLNAGRGGGGGSCLPISACPVLLPTGAGRTPHAVLPETLTGGSPPILQPPLPGQPAGTKPGIAGMLCPIPALLQSFTPSRAGRARGAGKAVTRAARQKGLVPLLIIH